MAKFITVHDNHGKTHFINVEHIVDVYEPQTDGELKCYIVTTGRGMNGGYTIQTKTTCEEVIQTVEKAMKGPSDLPDYFANPSTH